VIVVALEIDWCEPPLSAEARLKVELKKNPGRWARVKKSLASPTSRAAFRKEGFEAEAHPNEESPQRFDIYVRWPVTGGAPAVPTRVTQSKPVAAASEAVVNGAPARQEPPEDDTVLTAPVAAVAAGGYLAARAARHVPAEGLHKIGQRP
jgi:hypothetical protein